MWCQKLLQAAVKLCWRVSEKERESQGPPEGSEKHSQNPWSYTEYKAVAAIAGKEQENVQSLLTSEQSP